MSIRRSSTSMSLLLLAASASSGFAAESVDQTASTTRLRDGVVDMDVNVSVIPDEDVVYSTYLVDRAIPGYGAISTRDYRPSSKLESMYHEVVAFRSRVELEVLGGTLYSPAVKKVVPVDKKGQPIEGAVPEAVVPDDLPEEVQLKEYIDKVFSIAYGITYPNYYERQQLDACLSAIERSLELLRFGLPADKFSGLNNRFRVQVEQYTVNRQKAYKKSVQKIMEEKDISESRAERMLEDLQESGELTIVVPEVTEDQIERALAGEPEPSEEPVLEEDETAAPEVTEPTEEPTIVEPVTEDDEAALVEPVEDKAEEILVDDEAEAVIETPVEEPVEEDMSELDDLDIDDL